MINLEELGITKEDLQERVVNQLCHELMSDIRVDEDGEEYPTNSTFARKLDKLVKQHIDTTIVALAEKHVLPNVGAYIEKLTLQETNAWGEARGQKITFIEYLIQRAEAYLTEKVDYKGKPKGRDSYSWSEKQTRIAYMIHQYLQYSIETAMKTAVKDVNSSIVKGLEETVKMKLEEATKNLKVAVSLKK